MGRLDQKIHREKVNKLFVKRTSMFFLRIINLNQTKMY